MSTHAEDILYIFSPAKICTVLQNVDRQKLEVPTAICIDRMQLAGGGGSWAKVQPVQNTKIVSWTVSMTYCFKKRTVGKMSKNGNS